MGKYSTKVKYPVIQSTNTLTYFRILQTGHISPDVSTRIIFCYFSVITIKSISSCHQINISFYRTHLTSGSIVSIRNICQMGPGLSLQLHIQMVHFICNESFLLVCRPTQKFHLISGYILKPIDVGLL